MNLYTTTLHRYDANVHQAATINSLQVENGCLIIDTVSPWQEWFQVQVGLEFISNLVEPKTTIVGSKNQLNPQPSLEASRISISNLPTKNPGESPDGLGVRIVVTNTL